MAISGNFPSIRPSLLLDFANVGRLDPRVTFARASTARYYDGVTTAKAEQNLLLQSQTFNTTWAVNNATVTADTTVSPDGTTTADTITDNATSGSHRAFQSISISTNTTYVFSCWLKAGTSDYAYLSVLDDNNTQRYFAADFDLNAGTVRTSGAGTSGTLTSSSITEFPAGSGWYRCVIIGEVAAVSATTRAAVGVSDGTTAFNTTGTISYAGTGSTIIAWGAQLEQRSAVTAYTATTTQPITNYIPVLQTAAAGVARFDHTPTTGAALGLEIEEQRTNLLTYSEDFADAAWSKTRSSITSNTIVAPDGTLTGDKLVEDTTASNTHLVSQNITTSSTGSYTYSVFAKAGERTQMVAARATTNITSFSHTFDLSAGTASGGGVITAVGNGWYRCSGTVTVESTGSTGVQFRLSDGTSSTYTGDGYSGLFIWGAQLEAGAFATSYIPTTTTALTRSADAASMTGTAFSDFYNQAEGTIFAQMQALSFGTSGNPTLYSINTDASNRIFMFLPVSSLNFRAQINESNNTQLVQNVVGSANINDVNKTVIAYQTNNSVAYGRNTNSDDTSCLIPVVDKFEFGASTGVVKYIQRLAYYPSRLSNAQLQALTG